MAVKIRLARVGKKDAPFYRVVAIDSRAKRDGQALEILGTYDPAAKKLVQFHVERVQDWISKGAQVSDTVKRLQRLHRVEELSAQKTTKKVAKKAEEKVEAKPAEKKTVEKKATAKKEVKAEVADAKTEKKVAKKVEAKETKKASAKKSEDK